MNGFVASNYVSMDEENEVLSGKSHWLTHLLVAPRRLLCQHSSKMCSHETYNAEGIAPWVAPFHKASQWLVDQNAAILVVSLVPDISVALIASMLESTAILLAAIAGVATLLSRRKSKISVA